MQSQQRGLQSSVRQLDRGIPLRMPRSRAQTRPRETHLCGYVLGFIGQESNRRIANILGKLLLVYFVVALFLFVSHYRHHFFQILAAFAAVKDCFLLFIVSFQLYFIVLLSKFFMLVKFFRCVSKFFSCMRADIRISFFFLHEQPLVLRLRVDMIRFELTSQRPFLSTFTKKI